MTGSPALVDTNILCYALDTGEHEKQAVASSLLSRCWNAEITLAVSVQNLAEFSVVMTEKAKNPVPDEVIARFIRDISSFDRWVVISYDPETITDALAVRRTYSLHFWDALLVSTMKHNGIDTIYSEDSHFRKIPFLTVIDPFAGQ